MRAAWCLLLSAAVLGLARPARACSCGRSDARRLLIPASESTGFPTDGRIRVFFMRFPSAIRQRMGEEYRLREAGGSLVAIDAAVDDTMLTLTPRAPLRPRTRYTVERVFAYEAGSRLSDEERGRLAYGVARTLTSDLTPPPPATVSRYWFPEAWIETGDGPEGKRTETATLREVRVHLDGGGCGPGPRVWVRPDRARLGPIDAIGLERKGHGVLRYFARPGSKDLEDVLYLGNDQCTSDPQIVDHNGPFEFRVVTLTASGQRVVPPDWTRASVEGSAPERKSNRPMINSFEAYARTGDGPARWFSPPAREAPRQEPNGPASCPWGFEVQRRVVLAPAGGARPAQVWDPVAVAWRGGHVLIAGEPPQLGNGAGRVLSWRPDGMLTTRQLAGPGELRNAVMGAGNFLVALEDRETPKTPILGRVRVVQLDAGGNSRWSGAFAGKGSNSSPLMAWTPDRTLLCWHACPSGNFTRKYLGCAVLSSTDGRVLRAPFKVSRKPGGKPEYTASIRDAVVAIEGGFLVAWRPSGDGGRDGGAGVAVTRLDRDGNVLDIAFASAANASFLDLTRTSDGVVAAWDSGHAGVELLWLNPDGRLRATGSRPIPVSAGSGNDTHWPRLTARRALVAVTWQVGRNEAAFIAAADSTGAISPTLELAPGRFPHAAVPAASEDGIAVVYGLPEDAPQLELLRCRSQPAVTAMGAPQRLPAGP